MTVLYLPVLLLNSVRLLRYVKANEIDIVHINDLYNMVGVIIKMMFPKVRLVYHIRLLPTAYAGMLYPFWLRLVKKYADQIICVSQVGKKLLGSSLQLAVVSDAIDSSDIPARSGTTDRDGIINLLYLANYTKGKGQNHAIEAFARAVRMDSQLRLLFVGGDLGLKKNIEYRDSLAALAARENVADKIVFEGFASETAPFFNKADIFLNFSDSESFSLTCLEALMHGVAVISTDSGGPAELFEPGISGMLVPVGDVMAMAEAIVRLSTDQVLRERLAERGRQYASEKFDLAKSARQLEVIYLKLVQHESPVNPD